MAYKKILLAVSVYENTDTVINSAIAFAKTNNAEELQIVTVIDCVTPFAPAVIDFQHTIEEDAKEKLEALVKKIDSIKTSHEILVGNPASEITEYADENGCDLIVIGSHASHGLNLLLGSVANGILHKAKCDVLTIRVSDKETEIFTHNYNKILVPTDLENDSCEVVAKAKEIAKLYAADVDIAFVIPNDSISLMTYETSKVEKSINEFAERNNITGERSVLVGGVAYKLVEQAAKNKDDLIVIGSHRRNAIGRFFLGSTANSLLHEAKNDVLVVRLK